MEQVIEEYGISLLLLFLGVGILFAMDRVLQLL